MWSLHVLLIAVSKVSDMSCRLLGSTCAVPHTNGLVLTSWVQLPGLVGWRESPKVAFD